MLYFAEVDLTLNKEPAHGYHSDGSGEEDPLEFRCISLHSLKEFNYLAPIQNIISSL